MDELTADNLVLRVNSLGWSGCSYWRYKVMPLLVGAVAILLTQACNVRAEYEAPFSGKPLLRILQSSATVSCFSDLSATTGYYGKEEGKPDTFLTSAPSLRTVSPLGVVRSSRAAAWCAVSRAGVRSPFPTRLQPCRLP